MRKVLKISLIIIGIFVGIVLIDSIQARIFKHSPIISRKEELADADSWVDKGILIDTYYCTKEKDIITISWEFKGTKFTCPIDNVVEVQESNFIETEIENVSIDIFDISHTGATIVIKDTNKNPYTYGEWYKIEKEENGKWYALETIIKDYGFNDMGYLVDKNNEVKFVIDWEWLYGKLPLGSYRILKRVNNQYIAISFGIATTS